MKKIAIIGPESTGKSTLAKGLAKYFDEPHVLEYGRKYLEEKGSDYSKSDLLAITIGMLQEEMSQSKKADRYLFCDTDLIMMKVWYEVKFGECHPLVLEKLNQQAYDHYLLCTPDIPWEADPLRENPNIREELFERYQKELENYEFPYSIISGRENRLGAAIEAVENSGLLK